MRMKNLISKLAMNLLIYLLVLNHLFSKMVSALTEFPYVFGNSVGSASFYTMDIDSSNNIVAGGGITDNTYAPSQ
jgi:hypothetical protein